MQGAKRTPGNPEKRRPEPKKQCGHFAPQPIILQKAQKMSWNPHVTVATIVQRDSKYLMVKEHAENGIAYNQPAGHLEPNETLAEAAIRETHEETGWHIKITGALGISRFVAPANGETYVRFTFIGEAVCHDSDAILDDGIICATWLSTEDLLALQNRQPSTNTTSANDVKLRSPLVINDIERFERGERIPLAAIYEGNL